ncbi:MAG: hypothetical protein LC104_20725 [Bacteroidales bacterium]|nr:hypothetical protein [Bacteroidales bacterium]
MLPPEPHKRAVPPSMDELFQRFLQHSALHPELQESTDSEVELHEMVGEFRADTSVLWNEARIVFGLMGTPSERIGAPPDWKAFTQFASASVAPPLAAGFVPQRVRNLECWLEPDSQRLVDASEPVPPELPRLTKWLDKQAISDQFASRMIAAGLLCNLGRSSQAIALLREMQPTVTPAEQAIWQNQLGAAYWMAGDHEAAVQEWLALPDSGVKSYNLGLAAFLRGHKEEARPLLMRSVELLPESSGWSHLAELLIVVSE